MHLAAFVDFCSNSILFFFFLCHQYLCESNSSDMPRLLSIESDLENCCDKLDLLAPDPEGTEITEGIMAVQLLPKTLQKSVRGHSRHSSGDSGVYSTQGSGPRQCELGEVKVEKMGRKIQVDELDEGLPDVSI